MGVGWSCGADYRVHKIATGVINWKTIREDFPILREKAHGHPLIYFDSAAKSQKFAARMLEKGVYVIGFFYPVVPQGTARVRKQVSAAHSREDLEFAVNAFAEVNEELK
jgi:7-keto-8-aminopelargonate synthetase-like enzyme